MLYTALRRCTIAQGGRALNSQRGIREVPELITAVRGNRDNGEKLMGGCLLPNKNSQPEANGGQGTHTSRFTKTPSVLLQIPVISHRNKQSNKCEVKEHSVGSNDKATEGQHVDVTFPFI